MTVETRPIEAPVEPRTKTVGDVLRHAALIIEERGWCQRDYIRTDGAVCAVGAVWASLGYDGEDDYPPEQANLIGAAVDAANHVLSGYLIEYNDTPGRTAAEVTAALRAAADESDR